MGRMLFRGIACLALVLTALGCATGISKEIRSQVTYTGDFAELQQHPDQYTGKTVIWGGKIIQSQILASGTELMVLQLELDSADRPQDDEQSKGRFLVHSDQFLDPALYPQGTLITVVGPLRETQERLIGQMTYRYPVITVLEIKKWPVQYDTSPRIHFGIGVGKTF